MAEATPEQAKAREWLSNEVAAMNADEFAQRIHQARQENTALRAENARYRSAMAEIRSVVHANNRPVMSKGLRIRVRDMCDAALESEG